MSTTISYKHASLITRALAAIQDGIYMGSIGAILLIILVCLTCHPDPNMPGLTKEGDAFVAAICGFFSYSLIELFGFPLALAIAVYQWRLIRYAIEINAVCQVILLLSLLPLLVSCIYHGLMESRTGQSATLGKLATGVSVSDLNGNKISFMRAMFRYLAKGLSTLTCGLGYLMALGKTGQTLHDKLTGCIVLSKE